MRKAIPLLILLLTLSHPYKTHAQEQSNQKWNINFTFALKEIDKKYYFVVNGDTNLPDGTQLTVVLSYIYFLKKGVSEDFIPCEGYLTDKTLEVDGGKFYTTLGGYRRKPFSINYRCIVKFDPQNQFENVKDAVKGAGEFEKTSDMRVGSAKEFDDEIIKVRGELKDDFSKIDALFIQLKKTFEDTQKSEKFNGGKWLKFSKNFEKNVNEIAIRNEGRIGNWLMSLETQGKIYIGGLCDRLKELLDVCTKTTQSKCNAKNVSDLADAFAEIYNEEIYAVGFDTPIDAEKVASCLKKLKSALANSSESSFSSAIFELSSILPERYIKPLTALSEKFENANSQDVKSALEKLESQLGLNNRR